MLISRILKLRLIGLFILAVVLATSTYEFATANSVPDRKVGSGAESISGYAVSNVSYVINDDGDPTTLDKVTFDINAPHNGSTPTEVEVKLVSTSNTWFNCTAASGTQWSCDTTSAPLNIADMDELRVVAVQL